MSRRLRTALLTAALPALVLLCAPAAPAPASIYTHHIHIHLDAYGSQTHNCGASSLDGYGSCKASGSYINTGLNPPDSTGYVLRDSWPWDSDKEVFNWSVVGYPFTNCPRPPLASGWLHLFAYRQISVTSVRLGYKLCGWTNEAHTILDLTSGSLSLGAHLYSPRNGTSFFRIGHEGGPLVVQLHHHYSPNGSGYSLAISGWITGR